MDSFDVSTIAEVLLLHQIVAQLQLPVAHQ